MFDLLLGGIEPPKPPLIQVVAEQVTEQIIEPKELTLEEKIASNYYQCDESIEWIRADNAQCLPKRLEYRASEGADTTKRTNTPVTVKNTLRAPQNSSAKNLYAPGNCTYFAKSMRPDLPNNLGNANTWVARASEQGYATGAEPRVGAIGQKSNHVVYVTGVNSDGTFNLAEWNYHNLYERTDRTVSASGWKFIYK